jgi:hypothetical protein
MKIIYRFIDETSVLTHWKDVAQSKPYGPKYKFGVIGSKEWWGNIDAGVLPKQTARGVVRGLWFGQYHGGPAEFQMELPDGNLFGGMCYLEPNAADREFTLGRICEVDYVILDTTTIDSSVNPLEIWLELRLGAMSPIPVLPIQHTEQNFGRFSRIRQSQVDILGCGKQKGSNNEYVSERARLDQSGSARIRRTLAETKLEVERLAEVIGASAGELPTFGYTADGGRPHIEVGDLDYHYVSVERGKENSRMSTVDFEELLFQIFSDVTFHQAIGFELEHRLEKQDCRRIIFDHQTRMLSMLSYSWAERQSSCHAKILDTHPFDDFAGYYASHIASFQEAGLSYVAACKLAALVTNVAKVIAGLQRLVKRVPAW